MPKMLILDYTKCTGCRLCEMACSIKQANVSNPSRARIHIIRYELEGIIVPMLCQQCESPPCMGVCPSGAISRDERLGAIVVDYDKCIGCKMCVSACPFGGMGVDPVTEKVIKCNFCDGEPTCAMFCQPEALQYVEVTTANLRRKRSAALKLSELMRKFTST
jgi:Fe-S-cluster-containing hydrogenase component 2